MADEDLAAELAAEHHERINDVAEKLDQAETQLEAEIAAAAASIPPHDHPEYARHDQITALLTRVEGLENKLKEEAERLEKEIEESPAEVIDAEPDVSEEIPIEAPEPEAEPEYRRRHGRVRRVN